MAKTLLDGVNEVLKKAESIDSGGEFASLTDNSRQVWIDTAIQALNETIDELFDLSPSLQRPSQVSERTITLNTDDQDYALHSTLVRLLPEYGLIDETNNHVIEIDPSDDAYWRLIAADIEQDDTGKPSLACIRPTDGELWLDVAPTSDLNGNEYKYRFEKDLGLELATDVFPFTDPVFRALIAAATERYLRINHREFDEGLFNHYLARAASRLRRFPRPVSWDTTIGRNITDPLEA